MAYLPQETINEIKQNINIVDLIGNYVELQKKGNNYTASCPFHEDNHPSFSVSKDKQIFKCFSCGRGGNIFSFLQEIEGIGFQEAVAKAAELSGYPMDNIHIHSNSNNERYSHLYTIHELATKFYHHYLINTKAGQSALDYMLKREFTPDILAEFQVGLAPDNSELLLKILRDHHYSDDQILESGIFSQDDHGNLYDRFKNRIIFPLDNIHGKIVAFSGRIFSQTQSHAKYLNSPETPIFNKSKCLYNYSRAKQKSRQQKKVLICEGYMDVLSLYQGGISNVVATMGTSLTNDHLNSLSKLVSDLIFVFDGDEAGQKATMRSFDLLKSFSKLEGYSLQIPNKMDPDDWIKEKGIDSFNYLLDHSISAFDFEKRYLAKEYNLKDDHQLAEYIDKMLLIISKISSPIEKQLRLKEIAKEFEISEDILQQQMMKLNHKQDALNQHSKKKIKQPNNEQHKLNPPLSKQSEIVSPSAYQSEKTLFFNLIYYEEAWHYIEKLSQPIILFHDFSQKLFFILQEYYYDKGNSLPLDGVVNVINDSQMSQLMTSIVWDYEKVNYSDRIMEDCLSTIKKSFIESEILNLRKKMDRYRVENDVTSINKTMTQIMYLMRKIK